MSNLQIYNLFRKDKKELKNGLLIAFEGLDGSGKLTQVKELHDYLCDQGYKVYKISFPQYQNPIGKVISSYLRGEYGGVDNVPRELISIAYAADRVEASKHIKNLLNAGYIVLCDRYTYSNIFSAAKMEESKWMSFVEWVEDIEFDQLEVVKPNYNFYLHLDPEISIQRIAERGKRNYQEGKEDIHENNDKLLRDTSKAYLTVAVNRDNWIVIDQMKNGNQVSIEEAFELLKEEFTKILNNI